MARNPASSKLLSEMPTNTDHHVIVAGGGFAAVEALLALRDLAHDRVSLELISADRLLHYRPSATGAPFGADEMRDFDLGDLARRVGATFRCDAVAGVLPTPHAVRLASGATPRYDSLVLAIGARYRAAIPGALTFRDHRDIHHLERVLEELRRGRIHSLVFAAPLGVTWTLPLYELALLTARRIDDEGLPATVTLVTPERRPLESFGREASGAVGELLARYGVFCVYSLPRAFTDDGLDLHFGGTVAADRVIAIPQLVGPEIPGVPADFNGFIATDDDGRVIGLPDVYAAGDLTAYPVKQGGLATQQADTVAGTIAARAGAVVGRRHDPYVLRARLIGGDAPLSIHTELDELGEPVDAGAWVDDELPYWPLGKVVGRHLSTCLAQLEPVAPIAA